MFDEFKELFEYNSWATKRMFQAVSHLSREEFNRDLKCSFSSVRETMLHFISAEWIWLSRWNGVFPAKIPDNWDSSSLHSLQSIWERVNEDLIRFISNLDENQLTSEIVYRNIKGDRFSNRLNHMLRHVVNHSTYHRGQVTALLRQLGKEAVSTDLIVFYREKAARS